MQAHGSPAVRCGAIRGRGYPAQAGRRRPIATYVLIHGACRGGWIWGRVAPLLRAAGHAVYAPTHTGLGERSHLLSPEINLDTHIRDVLNVLEYEDLARVVLVGHSYGGMVITGVAERAPERLRHLVYLDAIVPADGQALVDFIPPEQVSAFRAAAAAAGAAWLLPTISAEAAGVTDRALQAWMDPRSGPQPLASFEQPLRVASPEAARLPRTYILCTEPARPNLQAIGHACRNLPGWRYRELATSHEAPATDPAGLASLLREIVE